MGRPRVGGNPAIGLHSLGGSLVEVRDPGNPATNLAVEVVEVAAPVTNLRVEEVEVEIHPTDRRAALQELEVFSLRRPPTKVGLDPRLEEGEEEGPP